MEGTAGTEYRWLQDALQEDPDIECVSMVVNNQYTQRPTLQRVGAEVLRLRLNPAARERAVTLAEEFTPEQALEVGFIDALVSPEQLIEAAHTKAHQLLELDAEAHTISKRRLRAETLRNIRTSLPLDLTDALVMGAKRAFGR